jgi:hypothetical protein
MNAAKLNGRRVCHLLLILAALAQTNLSADAAASSPHMFGMGRLGRDLVRLNSLKAAEPR